MDKEWTDWIDHEPGACPVVATEEVIVELENGDVLSPMKAYRLDWYCPGDDVRRYKKRK